MTGEPCPLCGAQPATTVGPVYSGASGVLWRRHTFEEQLYRCTEGHVYAVRTESGSVSAKSYDSVEEWLERTVGVEPLQRPPGL
jgi:hypothetical protein